MRPIRRITTVDLWRPLAFFGAAALSAAYVWASSSSAAASTQRKPVGPAAQAWAELEQAGHLSVRGAPLSLVQARQRPAAQEQPSATETAAADTAALAYGD